MTHASLVIALLLLLVAGGVLPMGAEAASALHLTYVPPSSLGRYAKYEVAFELDWHCRNPFDPDEITVEGVFVSPSQREVRVPAFADDAAGRSWKLRFAAAEVGRYRAQIVARAGTRAGALPLPAFQVTASSSRGFVHASASTPRRFQFQEGGSFLPISIVLWGGAFRDQPNLLPRLRQAGVTHFRLLMGEKHADGAFALEHAGLPVGRYDLAHARNLDRLFDQLDALDLYTTLNLIEHAEFRAGEPYAWFLDSPYHVRNGGPCAQPAGFFTSAEAKRLFRARLRYLVARWGYSVHLLMFQLWAEVDFSDCYAAGPEAVRNWHREMADYLHRIDPWGHLVSTSVTFRGQSAAYARCGLFGLPGLDVAATEIYNERDMAQAVREDAQHVLLTYGKPQWLAECGLQHELFADDDTEGIHVHGALWSSALSGAAGTPSFWWWSRILEGGWLAHFTALARFFEGEDLLGLRPVAAAVALMGREGEDVCGDLNAPLPVDDPPWGPTDASGAMEVTVPNDGRPPTPSLPRTLPPHRPVALRVNYAGDGEFVFAGWWLPDEGKAVVRARLDGQEVLAGDLPGVGWSDRFTRYRQYLGVPYRFPVPRGEHRIELENTGDAWVTMSVDLLGSLRPELANLNAYGLAGETRALLWITNRDNTWWRRRLGREPRPVRGAAVTLRGFRPGRWEVEWWDTYRGQVTARVEVIVHQDGTLRLPLPEVVRDVACKLRYQAVSGQK